MLACQRVLSYASMARDRNGETYKRSRQFCSVELDDCALAIGTAA